MPLSVLILAAIALFIFYTAERNHFRLAYIGIAALVVWFAGLLLGWYT
jgi:hypothetical protein